jgi:hypothetical protein
LCLPFYDKDGGMPNNSAASGGQKCINILAVYGNGLFGHRSEYCDVNIHALD